MYTQVNKKTTVTAQLKFISTTQPEDLPILSVTTLREQQNIFRIHTSGTGINCKSCCTLHLDTHCTELIKAFADVLEQEFLYMFTICFVFNN